VNTSTWIELVGLLVGGGGGGAAVAKLTRLAVSVEALVNQLRSVTAAAQKTAEQVQDHEVRITKGGL
jgi:hypothetical protein